MDFRQYGGTKGNSVSHYLIEFINFILYSQDDREPTSVLACLVDFAKAFNKVPHERLLMKCRGLGLDGKLLEWIMVWLSGRRQRVVLNGEASEWADVLSGVPRGSVPGLTLFLIFINDIRQGGGGDQLCTPEVCR